jgi:type IV fimbrial biogenesis protein FimT
MSLVRTSGFSLIELMVGLAIAALLVVLALPSYTVWIADAQIRNASESIASGLRYAQGEALKRNQAIEFVLDPTAVTGGWLARLASDTTTVLQRGKFSEGSSKVTFAVPNAATKITFNGLGFIAPTNADASAVLAEVRVNSAVAGARNLRVLAGGGASAVPGQGSRTGIKICDPNWPATDPKGCPA